MSLVGQFLDQPLGPEAEARGSCAPVLQNKEQTAWLHQKERKEGKELRGTSKPVIHNIFRPVTSQ